MNTRVVNIKAGEPCDIYIGRGSKWGNPFPIDHNNPRELVIEKYRRWIAGQAGLLAEVHLLRGKRLGCFCAPLPCHGDVLVALAERGLSALEE